MVKELDDRSWDSEVADAKPWQSEGEALKLVRDCGLRGRSEGTTAGFGVGEPLC